MKNKINNVLHNYKIVVVKSIPAEMTFMLLPNMNSIKKKIFEIETIGNTYLKSKLSYIFIFGEIAIIFLVCKMYFIQKEFEITFNKLSATIVELKAIIVRLLEEQNVLIDMLSKLNNII